MYITISLTIMNYLIILKYTMKTNNTLLVLEHYLKEQTDLNDLYHKIVQEPTENRRRKMLSDYSRVLIDHMEVRNKYKCRY